MAFHSASDTTAPLSIAGLAPDQRPVAAPNRPRSALDLAYVVAERGLALAMLLVLSPLFLAVAALVVLTDGPGAFYGHRRVGRGGRSFRCWKFRTMVRDADVRLEQLLRDDPAAREEWALSQKLEDDPRVLPFGRWLRRSSLDELPQLWNVVRGDMSLVGPRPITVGELGRYGAGADAYLSVRPGLTGPWQVSGRSALDFDARVALDVAYVRERGPLRDLAILLRTPVAVLRGRGAC